MHIKTFIIIIGILFISGCGPSAEEKEQYSYRNGYSDGYSIGYKKALECVDDSGGAAEDAAYDCER